MYDPLVVDTFLRLHKQIVASQEVAQPVAKIMDVGLGVLSAESTPT